MAAIKGKTKVTLEGRGQLTLRPNDHVATGGEGSVYRANDTVIKLYTDPRKMQHDGMPDKLKLLSRIKHEHIVSPKGLVTLQSGDPIGYYMDHVEGEPLSRMFTNAYRARAGFTDKHAAILADKMRDTVETAHSHKAILVDANELNWLSILNGQNEPEPRAIDVDSWAIERWAATVIMPSIRDWHAKTFNEMTDWFAWGIVTFQIFAGIHPYKGTLSGFKRNDIESRMKANASVFAQGVKLNKAVRDFSCIPGPLLDWYVATFEKGERTQPPSPFDSGAAVAKIARVARMITTATGNLMFEKLFGETNDPVIRIFSCGVVLLDSGRLINLVNSREIAQTTSRDCEVIKVNSGWLVADWKNHQPSFTYIDGVNLKSEALTFQLKCHKLLSYENRLFAVTEKGLTELTLKVFGKPILAAGHTWGVMINSTRWFDGLGIQDAMGATYVITPFNDNACAQIRVKELDGLKPIVAKSGNRFIAIIAVDVNGVYQKIELTLNRDYSSYKIWQGVVDNPDLNIAILPKGVCAIIIEDGEFDIFVPTNGTLNKVQDKYVSTDMILANWENKVVYIHDGSAWSVRMASK